MVSSRDITRVHITANDFEKAGLEIIGYYLKLYTVEQILTEKERSEEATKLATDLLNYIETFKNEIENEVDESSAAFKMLLSDQEKAMRYTLKFTMTLYNSKLLQLKDGPWDNDLKRGLWCCIDLFNCILHLWHDKVPNEEVLKKNIKLCKIYLSKLAKGEIGNSKSNTSDVQATVIEEKHSNVYEGKEYIGFDGEINSSIKKDLNEIVAADEQNSIDDMKQNIEEPGFDMSQVNSMISDAENKDMANMTDDQVELNAEAESISGSASNLSNIPNDEEIQSLIGKANDLQSEANAAQDSSTYHKPPTEEEIKAMIQQAKAAEVSGAEQITDEDNDLDAPVLFELPKVPDSAPSNVPKFVDESDEDEDMHKGSPAVSTELNLGATSLEPIPSKTSFTQKDIHLMMDKAETIEKIQKLAKYAISALNYEDIPTAKDELSKALKLLNLLE